MSEFIEAPQQDWFVTFYTGDDTTFDFVLRGWEFDEGNPIGHPCVDDPCELYKPGHNVRAAELADTFGWPHFDAGSTVVLLEEGQVLVGPNCVPDVGSESLNVDPPLRTDVRVIPPPTYVSVHQDDQADIEWAWGRLCAELNEFTALVADWCNASPKAMPAYHGLRLMIDEMEKVLVEAALVPVRDAA